MLTLEVCAHAGHDVDRGVVGVGREKLGEVVRLHRVQPNLAEAGQDQVDVVLQFGLGSLAIERGVDATCKRGARLVVLGAPPFVVAEEAGAVVEVVRLVESTGVLLQRHKPLDAPDSVL